MTNNAERELLPCPFCGGGGHIIKPPDTRRHRPQCSKCGAGFGEFDTHMNALNAWNTRAKASGAPDGWVLLPRELTAGNGAKYALIGEIPCHIDGIRGSVPWTSIKDVHKAVVRLFEGKETRPAAPIPPKSGSVPVERLEALVVEWDKHPRQPYAVNDLAELIAEYKA
jgi:Restriction alleviation protein Lar